MARTIDWVRLCRASLLLGGALLAALGGLLRLDRLEAQSVSAEALLYDGFSYPDGLVSNEWAGDNRTSPSAKLNPTWDVTSGSLFASSGAGWSGIPDGVGPNATSSNGTDSAVFRMNTYRSDFQNVAVTFRLLNQYLVGSTARTTTQAYDGVHIFLRHVSQYYLYYASINRRDNRVTIKKKIPGGPSNGGTYYDLTNWRPYNVPYGQWQDVKATVSTNDDGSVTINLYANGQILISATDNGTLGGAPIRVGGAVGIRGDNSDFKIDDFQVTAIQGATTVAPPDSVPDADARAPEKFLSPGVADGINDAASFGPAADAVSVYNVRGRKVFESSGPAGAVRWNGRDASGRVVDSGLYIARIRKTNGAYCWQSFAVAK